MYSQNCFLLTIILLSCVFGYFTLDAPACQKMCELEGHSQLTCAQEAWWPQMHLEAERLCHKACKIRNIKEDTECMELCFTVPVRDIIQGANSNSSVRNFFGRSKSHHSEVRVAHSKRIVVEKQAEILFPGPGLRAEELSAPDWDSEECECANPVGPTRIQFGLTDGTSSELRGRESIQIEGYMCPALGCFYEKQIPPPSTLRYNIPVRVRWTETIQPEPQVKTSKDPFARFFSSTPKPKIINHSVLMTFRKQGSPQYSGPVMGGDTGIRADLNGTPLTKKVVIERKPPKFAFWLSTHIVKTVQQSAITFSMGGACGGASPAVILEGPSGTFNVDTISMVTPTCKKSRTWGSFFCAGPQRVCERTTFSYTIIDPLTVVLDGTSIN